MKLKKLNGDVLHMVNVKTGKISRQFRRVILSGRGGAIHDIGALAWIEMSKNAKTFKNLNDSHNALVTEFNKLVDKSEMQGEAIDKLVKISNIQQREIEFLMEGGTGDDR